MTVLKEVSQVDHFSLSKMSLANATKTLSPSPKFSSVDHSLNTEKIQFQLKKKELEKWNNRKL